MSHKDASLAGIIPAMVTPATDDGSTVDVVRAKALTNRLISFGVHGLFACASTGEAPLLTREQRIEVIDVITEANAHADLPVLAGVGDMSTRRAIEYAKDAVTHGADYIVVMPLHFVKTSEDELYAYFAAVSESVDVPALLYNYPAFTSGQVIPPKMAAKLADSFNYAGIKDSSGDLSLTLQYVEHCGPAFSVFTGMDSLLLPLLSHGGAGAICASANIVPNKLVDLYNCFCEGEFEDALHTQRQLNSASHLWKMGTFPAAFKAACGLLGESAGPPFLPVLPLNRDQTSTLKDGIEKCFDISLDA